MSGSTLTVVDGAYTARFTLSGEVADAYVVVADGLSGAVVRAATGAGTHSLIQAVAGFSPEPGDSSGSFLVNWEMSGTIGTPAIAVKGKVFGA